MILRRWHFHYHLAHQYFQVGGHQPLADSAIWRRYRTLRLRPDSLRRTLVALHSEGGHASFTPANAKEAAILDVAWREFPHVSAERLLSGAACL
jgi:glucokinase